MKGSNDEERGCFGETGTRTGCGKVNVFDDADGVLAVEEGAVHQVGDILVVFLKLSALLVGDDDIEAGDEVCRLDGVDTLKFEDDAARVLADWKPVRLDYGSFGLTVLPAQGDALTFSESFGEVGHEIGEQLAFATLRAEQVGECSPHIVRRRVLIVHG